MTATNKTRCHWYAIAICASLVGTTAPAHAFAPDPHARADAAQPITDRRNADPSYRFSLSASAGLGGGDPGLGGRAGVGAGYWVTDMAGIALEASLMGSGELFGPESSAEALELAGALRSAPRGDYAVAAAGVGYARAKHDDSGLCINFDGGCGPSAISRYDAVAVALVLGWLVHPGDAAFEIGPLGRFDVVIDPSGRRSTDYVATLNLLLGVAWLR